MRNMEKTIKELILYDYKCKECGFEMKNHQKPLSGIPYYCEECLIKEMEKKEECQYAFWKLNKKHNAKQRLCRVQVFLMSGKSPKGKIYKNIRSFMLCAFPGWKGIGRSHPNKSVTDICECYTRWYYMNLQTFMEEVF
jgi:hypothetical protein